MGFGALLGKTSVGKYIIKDSLRNLGTNKTFPGQTYQVSGMPSWRNLSELSYLLACYKENPIVQAIINIKAEAFSNIRFKVKDLKTGEILPIKEYEADKGALSKLLSRPNPLQSTLEWLRQFKVNHEVFGNAYSYAALPVGFENNFSYEDISVINNLPSYKVVPQLTGKWLEATTKEEIIEYYRFTGLDGREIKLPTNKVFHANGINIELDAHFAEGRSKLIALQRPISNIDKAFESRNVLINRRGALGILTSDKKDESIGNVPLTEDEIKEVQDDYKKYGLMEDQYHLLISSQPLKYQKMAMSIKELMLFEEVEADAIAIANSFGVPELLVKYYIKGGTFNNLDASEKRLYDSTIIPESEDFMIGLNTFLNTEEKGIELIGSFDHLHALQINKKEEAETNNKNEDTALSAFMIGAIRYNQYLTAIGLPQDDEIGDLRIWDLNEQQRQALGIKKSTNNGTGEN